MSNPIILIVNGVLGPEEYINQEKVLCTGGGPTDRTMHWTLPVQDPERHDVQTGTLNKEDRTTSPILTNLSFSVKEQYERVVTSRGSTKGTREGNSGMLEDVISN